MACSVCREAGHTKRNCPKVKEEYVKLQRDRTNMFIQIFPALLSNPILQGLLWWQLSKVLPNMQYMNKVIIGSETLDFFDMGPDINIPQGVVLGALIQEAEKSDDYLVWLKKKVEAGEEIISESGYSTGQQVGRFWEWITTQDPFADFGSPSGIGN